MKKVLAIALVVAASGAALVGVSTMSTSADVGSQEDLRGIVVGMSSAPDRVGEWVVGERTIRVDRGTPVTVKLGTLTGGWWTQQVTGVLVHAPAWSLESAASAGFRPTTAEDAQSIRLGAYVHMRARRDVDGTLVASEIERRTP